MTTPTPYNRQRLRRIVNRKTASRIPDDEFEELKSWLNGILDEEVRSVDETSSREDLKQRFQHHLLQSGIREGLIAEIGGPNNSFAEELPDYDFEFLSLYPEAGRDDVLVADITNCDHIPSDRYDAVFSMSVLEHVDKPWLAGQQIARILKPGGITFHSVPFSYFYHGAPADYWRVTPEAMKLVFAELETIESVFFGRNRRRDNRGGSLKAVDTDGGEEFAVDAFGGWRENWHTLYCGKKNVAYAQRRAELAHRQTIINLVRSALGEGLALPEATELVRAGLDDFAITDGGDLVAASAVADASTYSAAQIAAIWEQRFEDGVESNYAKFSQWARFDGPARVRALQA